MLEWITRADRGPFSSVVVTDRVVSQALEPLSVLAMAGGATFAKKTRAGFHFAMFVQGGTESFDDGDAITTVLVSRADFLSSQRMLVKKLVAAHRELTEWIKIHPDEAQRMAREELDAAVAQHPNHANLRKCRADLRMRMNDKQGAVGDAAEAVILDSSFSSVLFPAPLRPMTPTMSPRRISKLTSCNAQ